MSSTSGGRTDGANPTEPVHSDVPAALVPGKSDSKPAGPVSVDDDLPEQMRVRRDKRARLLNDGIDPYPVGVPRTTGLAQLRAEFPDLEPDVRTGKVVGITGRVIFLRNSGKLCFVTLREGGAGETGSELQVMISLASVGAESLAAFKAHVDLGDHLFARGEVITSRRGELSVLAESWQLTSKSLRPLPVAHKPLSEENRVRQRYVDLIVRPQARRNVEVRGTVNRSLRNTLHERGYLEVETPMLQVLHGGAAARPFQTHMNAMDMDLFLRIAPELYLKRCVVGGIDRVFEINRNFRNEGADSSHSPEFAMLETYEAYSDYNGMAELTRTLVQNAAIEIFGTTDVTHADGSTFDLGGDWESITLYGALSEAAGMEVDVTTPMAALVELAEKFDVAVAPHYGPGKLAEELFEALVVPSLVLPTFVRDFPAETSPLTRAHRVTPGLAEKWDLYIRGVETATAYSELVDPVVQRERFVDQARFAGLGDVEAMVLDEDFLRAMEYGMPPAGGMGMGVDRLLMALTGLGIRETILFPFVRPGD
ncbi:lysyl-tRNA synthetase, class II [Nakamurella panacisegetis]|uniref:Lysine--tRNA ligase n=2 Tax=Nakamurella panacisegetis TaxID=1090615 RepID=A0A1H0NQ56_9ACTN|nr:lysine--tRNA ligase [Nakamurella panacisegetis]SDO94555.1 lysyl-tRNA synthetase, class II [Nakamurella panacisegetis]